MKDKNWIKDATKNKGAFTAEAKKRGMTPAELQRKVLANPEKYSNKMTKQANLRKTLVKMK